MKGLILFLATAATVLQQPAAQVSTVNRILWPPVRSVIPKLIAKPALLGTVPSCSEKARTCAPAAVCPILPSPPPHIC